MGQGTMTLQDAAEPSRPWTSEELAREAFEGRLVLAALPACESCGEAGPCKPSCEKADTQIVWLGDWFKWWGRHGHIKVKEAGPGAL